MPITIFIACHSFNLPSLPARLMRRSTTQIDDRFDDSVKIRTWIMKQGTRNYVDNAALMLADVEIQKEFPDLKRAQIRRIIEIYYDHVRRMEGGLPNYTVDGSGCDL